jgi:F420-dependent oxidoreductase-like protein
VHSVHIAAAPALGHDGGMIESRDADHPIRIGIKYAPQLCTIKQQRTIWRAADEAGFDHIWTMDHFNAIGQASVADVVFEGWTLLAAMAESTARARVGMLVSGNTYRHPGVLAKMAVTIDHLSAGRLEFGLGGSWADIEHRMLGIEFPPIGARIAHLDEACTVIRRLWTEDTVDHQGPRYVLTGAIANPKPVQRPHPPVWIGGVGERKLLRVAARHADVWNFPGGPGGMLAEAVNASRVLDRHCAEIGRDPAAIRRSAQVFFAGAVDPTVALLREFVQAGFTELIVIPTSFANAELAVGELLPRLRD